MHDPADTYGNVEDADFLLRLTEGEPWSMPRRWEDDAGAAIDISGADWVVDARLILDDARRDVTCTKTAPGEGWFLVQMTEADVSALPLARPGRLVVTIEDPAGQRFHFVFQIIRRPL